MALTRDSRHTVVERVKRDPAFAKALLDEAVTLFLNGEPDTARLVLRDLVNATVGFERLAVATGKAAKSLHRMLSTNGNPSMDNLALILGVLRKRLRVKLEPHGEGGVTKPKGARLPLGFRLSQFCHGVVGFDRNRAAAAGCRCTEKPDRIDLYGFARDRPGSLVMGSNPVGATNRIQPRGVV